MTDALLYAFLCVNVFPDERVTLLGLAAIAIILAGIAIAIVPTTTRRS